ncbi:MAG: hypothetical protein LBJ08_04170 [Bifidobacteriaceae bacterium]|nr:hypothetical protein [Bifidobacteriaceae bacterium]
MRSSTSAVSDVGGVAFEVKTEFDSVSRLEGQLVVMSVNSLGVGMVVGWGGSRVLWGWFKG